jgi:hypothetical protein
MTLINAYLRFAPGPSQAFRLGGWYALERFSTLKNASLRGDPGPGDGVLATRRPRKPLQKAGWFAFARRCSGLLAFPRGFASSKFEGGKSARGLAQSKTLARFRRTLGSFFAEVCSKCSDSQSRGPQGSLSSVLRLGQPRSGGGRITACDWESGGLA